MLITYRGQREFGRERSQDDGNVLQSEVSLAGQSFTVAIDRARRTVTVTAGGQRVERAFEPGVLPMENGHWQALSLAAEWFPDASTPRAVTVLVPGQNARVPATVTVRPGEDGARTVEVAVGPTVVTAEVSREGRVVSARVPSQGLVARGESEAAPEVVARPSPPGVTEEALEVVRDGVAIRGVLWVPADAQGPVPVAVIIAGSGPTDRDGNSSLGLSTDAYRLLAQQLAERGVATVRFDKRGVGASGTNFDPRAVVLEDFVRDALAVAERVRGDARFSSLSFVGHSEGGLIALRAASQVPTAGLVLLATAGRPLGDVLREQLGRQLDAATMTTFERLMGALRAGQPITDVPRELAAFFNPGVTAFMRSVVDENPVTLLRALRVPTVVVQGETDVQVGAQDARSLAAARRDVRLVLLPRMNHVLREEAERVRGQRSYTDPSLPLAPGVVDAVRGGIAPQTSSTGAGPRGPRARAR